MTDSKDDIAINQMIAELKAERAKTSADAAALLAGFDKQFAPIAEYIEKLSAAIKTVDDTATIALTPWRFDQKNRMGKRTCTFSASERQAEEHQIIAQRDKLSFGSTNKYLPDQFDFLKKQLLGMVKKYFGHD